MYLVISNFVVFCNLYKLPYARQCRTVAYAKVHNYFNLQVGVQY